MVDGGAFTQHKAKTIKKIMIVKQSKNRLQCNYTRVLLILSNGFSNIVTLQSGVRLYFLVKSFLNSNQMKQKKKNQSKRKNVHLMSGAGSVTQHF